MRRKLMVVGSVASLVLAGCLAVIDFDDLDPTEPEVRIEAGPSPTSTSPTNPPPLDAPNGGPDVGTASFALNAVSGFIIPAARTRYLTVEIVRGESFTGAVSVDVEATPPLPAWLTIASASIPNGSTTCVLSITAKADAPIGDVWLGKLRATNADIVKTTDLSITAAGTPGTLDKSFGSNGLGYVAFTAPESATAFDVGLEGDGGIVAVGYYENGPEYLWVVHVNDKGVPVAPNADAGPSSIILGANNLGAGVLPEANGSNVVMGTVNDPRGSFFSRMRQWRFLPDGGLDPAYGVGGIADPPDAAPQSNVPRIRPRVNGGVLYSGAGCSPCGGSEIAHALLIAMNANGTPDSTFGLGGVLTRSKPNMNVRAADVIDLQGRVAVLLHEGFSADVLSMIQYDGGLDPTFTAPDAGSSGAPLGIGAGMLARRADGKFVVAGSSQQSPADVAFTVVDQNGKVDTSFGDGGVAAWNRKARNGLSRLLIQPSDGKLLVVGWQLHRAMPNGYPDQEFGENGELGDGGTTASGVPEQVNWMSAVLQPDGRIVAAGFVYLTGGAPSMIVARYWP